MFCTNCGAQIDDNAAFCTNCGAPVKRAESRPGAGAAESVNPGIAADSTAAETQRLQTPAQQGFGGAAPSSAPQYSAPQYSASQQYSAPYAQPSEVETKAERTKKSHGWVVAVVIVAIVAVCAGGAFAMYQLKLGPFSTTGSDAQPAAASTADAASENGDDAAQEASSVTVPDLSGLTYDEATHKLQDLGLKLGQVTKEYSSSVEEGSVVSQSVSAGSDADPGSSVDLVVSQGAEPRIEHHFELVQQAVTWEEAKQYCESNGGYLAVIHNDDEYQQVLDAIGSSDVRVCWLGGYRDGDSWQWVNGDDFSWSSWASGEPNNDGGTENCLALLKNKDERWGWYDVPNDVSSYYKASYLGFIMETDVTVK
ncbi:zinc-ribbon domain-containing protein [Olsenella sp. KH3B4]|uniref:PASTA domain-containing protein n=1 Tax=Olsenella sp. KH3B4 TaxID=1855394 RepID=UPI0008D1E895|nr:PASTA domain-containing protein [Olsenella sp. KH3B4]SES77364.1 zinc-ribbon domain-containing protein [Olsenella sp. KH3B4]